MVDGLIATPIDADALIATPVDSMDCSDTNFLDYSVDILMMLMYRLILQDWFYGINLMML